MIERRWCKCDGCERLRRSEAVLEARIDMSGSFRVHDDDDFLTVHVTTTTRDGARRGAALLDAIAPHLRPEGVPLDIVARQKVIALVEELSGNAPLEKGWETR